MADVTTLSQYDLYFFSKDASEAVFGSTTLLDALLKPALGADWSACLRGDTAAYREAIELVIREATETTTAIRTVEQLLLNVSQWRELVVGIARNAPAARRAVLMQAAGYGLGSARSVKEMKDVLLTIKSRLTVHAAELQALGLAPALVALPGRVLARLESGAADVAREKAEESRARANAAELFGRVSSALHVAWRSAELVATQAQLLAAQDEATAEEKATQHARADAASTLSLRLDKALGEARVEARQHAAAEPVPPELVTPADGPVAPAEQLVA